ncbi:porin [Brumimicrobium mesophilum]|uniref:porin n=1 Tax=Brumimicrobium mesophilum TaxID=392717 RepID=UPI000D14058C|nr:porin [Brumimicrobium mesophilum]
MLKIKRFLLIICVCFIASSSFSQIEDYSFGEGIRYQAKDSSFSIKASFRFQNLFIADWNVNNDDFSDIGNLSTSFMVRRSRLKFSGFAHSPKLKYKLEIGLSNRDINHQGAEYYGEGGNMIYDAYLKWNFYKAFSLKVGQYKMAGNRERVISSANLQFVDRSALNARFNLDRDIGASLHFEKTYGKQFGVHFLAGFFQGEGRNIISGNRGGYETTLKLEVFPFGKFSDKGAYFGADLAREQTPKLAIAVAYDQNNGVARTRANLGSFLPDNALTKNISSIFADFIFKYKGFSMMGEYAYKSTNDNDPRINDIGNNFTGFSYYTGSAVNLQAGLLFKNDYELAARYTLMRPQNNFVSPTSNHYTIGASKYFKGHSLKVQTDVGYIQNDLADDGLVWRMQLEIGF